jgi:thioredoxin 1
MSDKVASVSDADFSSRVLTADRPVLVDFWAEWCGPCRMISPVVEQLAEQFGQRVDVLKLDIDQNPATVQNFGVMSVPTVVIFKDGKAVDRSVGYRPGIQDDLARKLTALLPSS